MAGRGWDSLCRVCFDAFGLSAELGLVSPKVSGIGRISEQHLAPHFSGVAGRGPQSSSHRDLPAVFKSAPNEWYRWKNNLRANPDIKVLLSIDPASFPLGTGPKPDEIWHRGDYPVVWTNQKYK